MGTRKLEDWFLKARSPTGAGTGNLRLHPLTLTPTPSFQIPDYAGS
jgi:hypothetical protein